MNVKPETISPASDTSREGGSAHQSHSVQDQDDKRDAGDKKKTRKRTGCFTCRRRKKACDERHPVCESCERLEIPCIYPKIGGQVRPRPASAKKKHGEREQSNDLKPPQPSRQISSSSSHHSEPPRSARQSPQRLLEVSRDVLTTPGASRTTALSLGSGGQIISGVPGLTSSPVAGPAGMNGFGEFGQVQSIPSGSGSGSAHQPPSLAPAPLRPPLQQAESVRSSGRPNFFAPPPEGKPILDPNTHISSASYNRDPHRSSAGGHSINSRRLSEQSLTASYISSVPTDSSHHHPDIVINNGQGSLFPPPHHTTITSGSHEFDPLPPAPLPVASFDYMQSTGHMLDHPTNEIPVALDQTLVDFIKTMEQSESEWANFILAAGDGGAGHEHGAIGSGLASHGHVIGHESNGHHGTATPGRSFAMEMGGAGHQGDQGGEMPRNGMEVDYQAEVDIGEIPPHILASVTKASGNGDLHSNIHPAALASIASQSLPSWIWSHVPVLIDYFVNGFGPIISVLGAPSKHSLVQSLLPLAANSPLLLPALIGWSASHLARIGEPYASIARIATEVTDRRVQSLLQAGAASDATHGDVSLEDKLWIVLMLGGIEICKGSVNRWKELLPKIRNLVTLLQRSRPDERYSDTQISLALNCIYHDVSWSVACKDDPQVPVETYGVFIRRAGSKPDMYLGICAPIYQVLSYIAALGARATSVHLVEDADDRFEHISRIIEEARGLGHRIDLLEVSSRTLSEMAAWQKDEESFNPQPLISTFQAFKSAAHAYLRQIVYRTPAIALEAQLSVARMLTTISTVLNTPSQSQILFPLFVAGVDAIREEDRNTVRSIFEKLHTITGTGNIQHIFTLLLSVWKVNDKGTTWVDWRQIASDMEFTISFA